MIRIVSSDLRVMVPKTTQKRWTAIGDAFQRHDKVLGFLEKGKFDCHHDWKHRFKKIRSACAPVLAESCRGAKESVLP